ncbi:unnamed protein product [Polarella glacialis]|uniref:PsbP C-terminal domain-containing protein n=1 Tax=Polarella glacialis TaxID=89957 RepID=A0A813IJE9_POLGL|nr:unnamed protein product [Polarella glacialis]CAE8650368.1 unnamed protein product [Polarella glacialis]|mmetsp:Transcript_44306/g.80286  ORF Transcript_44306/g.80286 Transcript_44306/m.80286 type:complete len:270 (+) Transcript_44306:86-895(+)
MAWLSTQRKMARRPCRSSCAATAVLAAVALLSTALPISRSSSSWAFAAQPAAAAPQLGQQMVPRRLVLGGASWAALSLVSGVSSAEAEEQLKRYVEKDPALPGFQVSHPAGWAHMEQTIKQNMVKDYGRILSYTKDNSTIEVSLQPIEAGKDKLSDFGSPETFANAFANSAAKVFAPPNSAAPSPVPTVTQVSVEADKDLRRMLTQYRLEVKSQPERPALVFEQLVGLGRDSEQKNYLYSLTAMAPEAEFESRKKLFAEVFASFEFRSS